MKQLLQCKVIKKAINRKGEIMKKKARGIVSNVVKLISDENMQILPGQLAFFIILSFFSIIPLIGLITSSFISIDLIKDLENSLPSGVYQILEALLDVKSYGSIIIFVVVALYFSSDGANALIITSGGLNNNVDIHLEGVSQYPSEEEVLFLPFCLFTIKSFAEVKDGSLIYYKLELENNLDASLIEPYNDHIIKRLNGENNYLF